MGGGDVFVNKSNPLYMDISWFTYIIKTAMNLNYLRKQTRKEYWLQIKNFANDCKTILNKWDSQSTLYIFFSLKERRKWFIEHILRLVKITPLWQIDWLQHEQSLLTMLFLTMGQAICNSAKTKKKDKINSQCKQSRKHLTVLNELFK